MKENTAAEREKQLSYYQNLNYEIILKRKDDGYLLIIPELSIYSLNNDLETGYAEIMEKKNAFFKVMIDDGNQKFINLPDNSSTIRKNFLQMEFIPFLIKFAIVAAFVVVLFVVNTKTELNLYNNIQERISGYINEKLVNARNYFEKNFKEDNAAALPDEKKKVTENNNDRAGVE